MDSLDDIKYAVIDNEAGDSAVLAFFRDKEDAEKCAAIMSDDPDEPLQILSRSESEFHIDIHTDITSSFDLRI